MSQPSKEQWQKIEDDMNRLYANVYLECESYRVSAGMARDKNRLVCVVYVDGVMRGDWFGIYDDESELSDIQRRFCRPIWKPKYPRKFVTQMEKIQGKRKCKAAGYYDKRLVIYPYWASAKRFISHLKKHNQNIRVLTSEEHKAALDAKAEAAP